MIRRRELRRRAGPGPGLGAPRAGARGRPQRCVRAGGPRRAPLPRGHLPGGAAALGWAGVQDRGRALQGRSLRTGPVQGTARRWPCLSGAGAGAGVRVVVPDAFVFVES